VTTDVERIEKWYYDPWSGRFTRRETTYIKKETADSWLDWVAIDRWLDP
jgi:hypothetical protein